MQERFYESGSCVQKNCAILGVHPRLGEQSAYEKSYIKIRCLLAEQEIRFHVTFLFVIATLGSAQRSRCGHISPGWPSNLSDVDTCLSKFSLIRPPSRLPQGRNFEEPGKNCRESLC